MGGWRFFCCAVGFSCGEFAFGRVAVNRRREAVQPILRCCYSNGMVSAFGDPTSLALIFLWHVLCLLTSKRSAEALRLPPWDATCALHGMFQDFSSVLQAK